MALERRGVDEVRERIIESGLRLFSRHGYSATSIREIAEEAATTKPMIYYYFGSKAGLYTYIIKQEFSRLAEELESVSAAATSTEEGLQRFVTAYYRFFLHRSKSVGLLYKELFGLGESLLSDVGRTYFSRVKNALGRVLRMEQERLGSPVDVETTSVAILGILNIFLLRRLLAGQRFRVRPVVQQVVGVYLEGLRGAAASRAYGV